MATTTASKAGPHRSRDTDVRPPATPAPPAVAAADLAAIDEEMARQVEQVIQAGSQDPDFDLEGDFLSQEEIARVMATETGRASADSAEAAADQPPPGGDLATNDRGSSADMTPIVPAVVVAAVEEQVGPVAMPPLPTSIAPSPDELPATSAAAGPPDELSAPLAAATVASAPAPAAVGAVAAEKPAHPPARPDDHAGQLLDSNGDPPAEGVASWPRWQRMVLSVANVLDRPFRRLPGRIKNILGIVGAAAMLAAGVVWVMALR